jgi:ATP-binding cassette subfamily C protein EexD
MIWSLFRIFKRELFFVLFVSMIINVLFLVSPWYMMQIADKVFVSRSMESLTFLTMILLWMFLVMGLLEFVRSRVMAAVAFRVEGVFYPKLYEALLVKSSDGKIETPDQYFNELNMTRNFISGEGMFGLLDLLWVPIYFVVLMLFSWKLAVFALFIVTISFMISYANHYFVHDDYEEAYELNFKANDELLSQLRSIEAIKSMGMYEGARERWFERHSASSTAHFRANEQLSIWYSLSKNFRYVSMTLIMAASAYLVIENELTVGMMAATGLLLGRVIMPIDMLGSSLKHIMHMKHSMDKLKSLIAERRIIFAKNKPLLRPDQGLSVQELVVCAPDDVDKILLNNITFVMPPASCLVILGPNGAGKTTLLRTLSGLLLPTTGKIEFSGVALSRLSAYEIGYVSQDVRLLDGTIAENICRFGDQDADKLIAAGQLVGIHDFVMTLKEGYHAMIGDGVLMLSGGQRQLIALARAIYDQPAFLILDEPNSSLDEQGQKALLRVIQSLKQQGTTVIVSTHQYSLLPYSDYILTMSQGEVQLFESRQELINRLQSSS